MLKDLWLNSQFSILNSCDKREQSQARLNYAERSKNLERSEKFSILNSQLSIHIVAPLGVEPRRTEPESAVLPLHNRAEKVASTSEATFYIIN